MTTLSTQSNGDAQSRDHLAPGHEQGQGGHGHGHDDHGHGGVGHVVSPATLLLTWVALLIGTVLTVAITYVDLGAFSVWLALGVAVAKASLVALYFMHLRWDSLFNGVVLIAALLFLMAFIGVAMMDTAEYQDAFELPRGVILESTP